MKKRCFVLLGVLLLSGLFSGSVRAQSGGVNEAGMVKPIPALQSWQKKVLADGLVWYHILFDSLNGVPEYVNVLEVNPESGVKLSLSYDEKELKTVSQRGMAARAFAAVNGNFFHTAEGGSVCYFRWNNKVIDTSRTDLGERLFLDELDDGALCFEGNTISIMACPAGGWKTLKDCPDLLSAGPLLLMDGKPLPLIRHSFNDRRYSRTGIGITASGHILIITVDGHLPESAGMRMGEFRDLFLSLGCRYALNLDGGGSTTMWIKGEPGKGIVNRFFGGELLVPPMQRPVANAIVILKK